MNFKKWFREWRYDWFIAEEIKLQRKTLLENFEGAQFRLGKMFGDFPDNQTNLSDYKALDVLNIAENLLLLQNEDGSWGKNLPIRRRFSEEQVRDIYLNGAFKKEGDLDNGANWKQLRLLAEAYSVTKCDRFLVSASKCLDWILDNQNKRTGAWQNKNHPHITYNDDVTQGVLVTFQDILTNDYGDYDWVSDEKMQEVENAYAAGIECVIKTQHRSGGWCQQHDNLTLEPRGARSYEGPWLATRESGTICEMLERHLTHVPYIFGADVEVAIERCKFWLVLTRLRNGSWPRFVFPGTTTAVFCDRDGNIYKTWEELPEERRYGYGWFVTSPWRAL